jgi:hypothetical protein
VSQYERLKVINLFGPPGVGKSAARSGVFWLMKTYHMSIEEVSEYAKYLVLTGRTWQLQEEQLYLLAKQNHKQVILRGQYEYAVTDSPLALCAFYAPKAYMTAFFDLVAQAQDQFDNINFYLTRDLSKDAFELAGRLHDREASLRVDAEMREYLARKNTKFIEVPTDRLTPWRIAHAVRPDVIKLSDFPHSLIAP